ncbi:MAG: hypothetical protein BAJALOKI2v1_780001 [Promethearchaeota archaeon]|nr:MAG: hypothetical protein BAJALOKI2v1_780001 [Candidatus Lokiarchaeota archaeon]
MKIMKKERIQKIILKYRFYLAFFLVGIILLNSIAINFYLLGLKEQVEIIGENQVYNTIYGSWEVRFGSEEEILSGTDKFYEAISKYFTLTISMLISILLIIISALGILYLLVLLIRSKSEEKDKKGENLNRK